MSQEQELEKKQELVQEKKKEKNYEITIKPVIKHGKPSVVELQKFLGKVLVDDCSDVYNEHKLELDIASFKNPSKGLLVLILKLIWDRPGIPEKYAKKFEVQKRKRRIGKAQDGKESDADATDADSD